MKLTQKQKNISLILISILIEALTYIMFPTIECNIKSHKGSIAIVIYIILIIISIPLLLVELSFNGINWTVLLLVILLTTLFHVTYLINSIECCPEG